MAAASSMLTAASLSFSPLPAPRLRAAASLAPPRRAAAALVVRAAAASSKSPAAAEAAPKKKRATGITQPKPVSPALQAIVGEPVIPRTEALKRLWAYIKERNLQVPEQKPLLTYAVSVHCGWYSLFGCILKMFNSVKQELT
jgi:hypothetical protein